MASTRRLGDAFPRKATPYAGTAWRAGRLHWEVAWTPWRRLGDAVKTMPAMLLVNFLRIRSDCTEPRWVERVSLLWLLTSRLVTRIVVKIKCAALVSQHQKQTSVELAIDLCHAANWHFPCHKRSHVLLKKVLVLAVPRRIELYCCRPFMFRIAL